MSEDDEVFVTARDDTSSLQTKLGTFLSVDSAAHSVKLASMSKMAEGGSTVAETTQESDKAGSPEQELATRMLQIQPKRFYLDVKQNRRGRFIKLTEVGVGGRKNRLLMSMAAATDFRNHLNDFAEFYVSLGQSEPQNVSDGGRLKSEVIVKENRRYYLDLKENNRGRFLRVTQTLARGGSNRAQVAIPAQGIVEMRDALSELLEEFGKTDSETFAAVQLPEGKQFRAENKMFYFDIGQNQRGVFMRVTEVKSGFRNSITIPERCWSRFRDYFGEVCDKMASANHATDDDDEPVLGAADDDDRKEEKAKASGDSGVRTSSGASSQKTPSSSGGDTSTEATAIKRETV